MTDTIHPTEPRAAKKPASLAGMVPATDIESYDLVPWYRKTWFVFLPLLAPALIVAVLTGNVYAKANSKMRSYSDAEVWRYTTAARVYWFAAGLAATAFWSYVVWTYVT